MYKYEIKIYWSDDDKAYVAEVPELPGCRAKGKTCIKAVHNIETVITQWIEAEKETGREPPQPKGKA